MYCIQLSVAKGIQRKTLKIALDQIKPWKNRDSLWLIGDLCSVDTGSICHSECALRMSTSPCFPQATESTHMTGLQGQ